SEQHRDAGLGEHQRVDHRLARPGCRFYTGPPVDVPVGEPGAQPQRHDAADYQPLARGLDPENPPGVTEPMRQLLSGDARPWAGKAAEWDSHRIGLPPVTAS